MQKGALSESGAKKQMPPEDWDADHYGRNMRFVADLALPLVDQLLAPRPGERVLDLGCGDGVLSQQIADRGCSVVAVDYSPSMVDRARELGLDAHVVDAQKLPYESEFDAVFSNAALHWMSQDPDAVLGGVRRALKPGGRFVGEMGGFGNVAAIVTALLAVCRARGIDGRERIPWYFPTADEYKSRLEAQGFEVAYIELIPRPTTLATGMGEWFTCFCDTFFEGFDPRERSQAEMEALELLQPSLCSASGTWVADYVRLRFQARLR